MGLFGLSAQQLRWDLIFSIRSQGKTEDGISNAGLDRLSCGGVKIVAIESDRLFVIGRRERLGRQQNYRNFSF